MPAKVACADQNDLPKVGALGEAEHGPHSPFDKSVIGMPHHLLDNVIQVFALADFDAPVFVGIELFYRSCVGPAFVDIDEARFSVRSDGFV